MRRKIFMLRSNISINGAIRTTTIFLVAFLPIIFNPFGFDLFALPRVFFLYFCSLFIVLLLILSFLFNKKIVLPYTWLHGILYIFAGFIIISVFFSPDKYTSLWGYVWDYEGLFSWISYFIIFYIGYVFFRKNDHIEKLFFYLSFILLIVSLYAIFQYMFDWQLMDWMQKTEIKRATSFLGHPSYLGIYLLLLLPNIFYLAKNTHLGKEKRFFFAICVALALIALILSFSRGAWVAFAAVICCFTYFNIRPIREAINKYQKIVITLLVLLVLLSVMLGSGLIGNNLLSTIGNRAISIADPTSATTQVRSVLYRQSLLLLKDNWLTGIGPDNFAYVVPQYFLKYWYIFKGMVADKAHNQVLDYWISFGIGGILSYLLFLGFFFRYTLRARKKLVGSSRAILEGLILSAIGFLAAVQFHYSTIDLAPLFWLYAGIGLGVLSDNKIIHEYKLIFKDKNFNWRFSVKAVIIIGFILLTAWGFYAYNKISADILFSRGVRNNVDTLSAVNYLERAIKRNPHVTNYFLALNLLYLQLGKSNNNTVYLQKAVDNIIGGIKYIPRDYRLHYQLGDTYMNVVEYAQNKKFIYKQSQKAYREALRLYPTFVDAHLKLGVTSAHLGEDEVAQEHWLICTELDNRRAECYYNLYKLFDKRGENKKASKYYRRYLNIKLN